VKTYTAKSAEREDVTVKSRQNCSAPTFHKSCSQAVNFKQCQSLVKSSCPDSRDMHDSAGQRCNV